MICERNRDAVANGMVSWTDLSLAPWPKIVISICDILGVISFCSQDIKI